MRIKYSEKDLMGPYDHLVEKAIASFDSGNIRKCISLIRCAADYQYSVNSILSDSRLEKLLKNLTGRLVEQCKGYKAVSNSILLYDYFTIDNRGLTQQYLDALVASGKYDVTLVHDTVFGKRSVNTLKYCSEHNVKTFELGTGDYFERERKLLEIIFEIRPQKVLFHLYPSNVLPLVTFGAFSDILKYQINLTDHAFWLGSQAIDYSVEFRNLGCSRSEKLRGLRGDQLLLLPYYPWMEETPFQGFPEQATGKVVLFAGASLYKIEGGNGTFYKIVKRILDNNPQCTMLFAGEGDRRPLLKFIKEYNYENRLILIGERTDIYEVFKHSDIYLNTYPLFGGLMSQYAALLGKPILTYEKTEVEEVVCTKKNEHFVFDSIDALLAEADKLINDAEYRHKRGDFFKELTLGQDDFRTTFLKTIESNKTQIAIVPADLQMDFYNMYRNQINEGKLGLYLERLLFRNDIISIGWKMWFNIIMKVVEKCLTY